MKTKKKKRRMTVDKNLIHGNITAEVERLYLVYSYLCCIIAGEENEEEEEEEEEGSSNYEEDGIDIYREAVEHGVVRMFPSERDDGNVVMIQHNIDNHDIANATITSTPVNTRPSLPWNTTFPLPLGLFEEPPTGSENNGK